MSVIKEKMVKVRAGGSRTASHQKQCTGRYLKAGSDFFLKFSSFMVVDSLAHSSF